VTSTSALAVGADAMFDRYARMVRRVLKVPVATVTLVESDRQVYSGLAGDLPEPWRSTRETPLSHSICQYVVRDRASLVVRDAREDERLLGNRAIPELGVVAYAGWPITDAGGDVVGSLSVVDHEPREWEAEELATLEDLATACSTELAQRELSYRSRVLLELSQGLSDTNDLAEVAAALEKVTLEQLGCLRAGIWLRDVDRALTRIPVTAPTREDEVEPLTFVDPSGRPWEAAQIYSVHRMAHDSPLGDAVLRGEPVFYRSKREQDERFPQYTSASRIGESRAFVPLGDAERTYGVLVLLWDETGEILPDRRITLRALGVYTSQAIQRALLNQQRLQALVTLQNALMPTLPEPETLELAARYLPAARQSQIGGDWYDAVIMPSGLTALMVGDVVGHDISAAAQMGQIRNTLRAFAWAVDDTPAANVARLDEAMGSLGVEGLATLVYARIEQDDEDREAGRHQLRWTSAGHPPMLVVTADGGLEWLASEAPDSMLGLDDRSPRADNRSTIPPGSTLLMFTDGLVERRDEDLDVGLDRLGEAAARHRDRPLGEFLDAVLGDLLDPLLRDDVAVLAVRFEDPNV
jgi:serine phosphatase RsbU (regulator of sigma subunit)